MISRLIVAFATLAIVLLGGAALMDNSQFSSASARGDRIDIAEDAARCRSSSLIAACAVGITDNPYQKTAPKPSLLQVFELPNETILVKSKIGM